MTREKGRGGVQFQIKGVDVRGMADLRKLGRPVEGAGFSMVDHAPARGRLIGIAPTVVVSDDAGGARALPLGRLAMRERDVWDVMQDQSGRRGGGVLFTPAEVATGRAYRGLTERVASAGVKGTLAAFDAPRAAGGGCFMDAYIADAERLRAAHDAIGWGASLAVRRVRPSARGSRMTISDRQAVDMLCLADKPLSAVLQAFGWSVTAKTRAVLREAVSDALGRMAAVI